MPPERGIDDIAKRGRASQPGHVARFDPCSAAVLYIDPTAPVRLPDPGPCAMRMWHRITYGHLVTMSCSILTPRPILVTSEAHFISYHRASTTAVRVLGLKVVAIGIHASP